MARRRLDIPALHGRDTVPGVPMERRRPDGNGGQRHLNRLGSVRKFTLPDAEVRRFNCQAQTAAPECSGCRSPVWSKRVVARGVGF